MPIPIRIPTIQGETPHRADGRRGRKGLYTATLRVDDPHRSIAMFHACHAMRASEVMDRLLKRIPAALLSGVSIRAGIDPSDPIVVRLLPGPMLARLVAFSDCSPTACPLAAGGDLNILESILE